MKKSLILFTALFLLAACNDNSNDLLSSEASSSSNNSSMQEVNDPVESLNDIKEKLKVLDKEVSKETYKSSQIDNYSALEMEVKEDGETFLYKNDFLVQTFTQTINDSIEIKGKRERGINNNNFYQINYYGEQDKDNSVTYYVNNEANKKAMFTLGFVSNYVINFIDPLISEMNSKNKNNRIVLQTNYDGVEVPTSGNIDLQFIFTQYDASGRIEVLKMNRVDHLVISDNKVISSKSKYLYSLQENTNYRYIEIETSYFYDPISDYKGDKLNPSDFPIYTPTSL